MKALSIALLLFQSADMAFAADLPEKPAEIRAEIERLKARIRLLEMKLTEIEPVELQPLNFASMQKGATAGKFGTEQVNFSIYVDEVIDDESLVAKVGTRAFDFKVLISKFPTGRLVDGALIDSGGTTTWRVMGTKKVNGTTIFMVEPLKAK